MHHCKLESSSWYRLLFVRRLVCFHVVVLFRDAVACGGECRPEYFCFCLLKTLVCDSSAPTFSLPMFLRLAAYIKCVPWPRTAYKTRTTLSNRHLLVFCTSETKRRCRSSNEVIQHHPQLSLLPSSNDWAAKVVKLHDWGFPCSSLQCQQDSMFDKFHRLAEIYFW